MDTKQITTALIFFIISGILITKGEAMDSRALGLIRDDISQFNEIYQGKEIDLSDADLSRMRIENASLVNANLRGANLRDTHFKDSVLTGADLSGTRLHKTIFEKSTLDKIIIKKTRLLYVEHKRDIYE